MTWAAVAAAGATVIGGAIQSDAGKSAAKKAKKGSDKQIAFNREAMNLARADTRHTRQASATALNALMRMTGLSGGMTTQRGEDGYPVENTGGALAPPGAPVAEPGPEVLPTREDFQENVGGRGQYRSAYNIQSRAMGGPMYNINEMGPENVHSGGAVTRNPNPMTIDGRTGYVEPNIQGRASGGNLYAASHDPILGGVLGMFDDKPKRGKLPGTDWVRNEKGRLAATGQGHWNNDLGMYVDRRGRPKAHQTAPPEGYVDPSKQTDIDTTQGQDFNWQADPGYQFRFDEGMAALDRSAAARGGLLSGGFGRKAIRYGQGFASNEYSNVYNRIANIAGMGQVANQGAGQAALVGGQQMGAGAAASGINSAYGDIAQGNAIGKGLYDLGQVDWGGVFNRGQPTTAKPGIGSEYRPTAGQAFGSWKNYNPFKDNN